MGAVIASPPPGFAQDGAVGPLALSASPDGMPSLAGAHLAHIPITVLLAIL
jgi:hypothetical protein